MADERADLLERAQLLQKAKIIQAQKQAEPGTQAMGFPDGPTVAAEEEGKDFLTTAKDATLNTLGAGAKILDTPRGVLTAPLLAKAIEGLTGKKVADDQDYANAINPTNLKTFPSSAEMFERAGVPEGAKLSDYMGGFADPSANNPWYKPEKGGMLDVTLRGAGGMGVDTAIDPLTYLSFGASAAGKRALQESASRAILSDVAKGDKGLARRALEKVGSTARSVPGVDTAMSLPGRGADKLADVVDALKKTGAGRAATAVATAPSSAIKSTGRSLYNSVLLPLEQQGRQFGKKEVGETLYNAGIKTPLGLGEKADQAVTKLLDARRAIVRDAADQGAQMNMSNAMKEAQETVDAIRAEGRPNQQHLADALEQQINAHMKMVEGVKGVPPRVMEAPSGKLDWKGDPIMEKKVIPGTDAVPGKRVTPETGLGLTTDIYGMTPNAAWNELQKTPAAAQVTKPLSNGLRSEVQRAVAEKLGPKAGADVAELGAEAGKILSTKRGGNTVEKQAERIATNLKSPTGTDSVIAGLGEASHEGGGLKALALKKLIDAGRLGTMPLGYGLRKAGESTLMGPLADIYFRNKLKQYMGQGSERENSNGKKK